MKSIEMILDAPSILLSIVEQNKARQIANGYLSRHVGIPFGAVDGVLVPLAPPLWQFAIEFNLPRFGRLGIMGTIDVDAKTGQPLPLAQNEIGKIQDRADAIVQLYTQTTAA